MSLLKIYHSSPDYPVLTGREVSRDDLLTSLLEAWRAEHRVLGLYGRAGMGKSIAALQAVAALQASGLALTHALWLELRICPDAGGILSQLADCLHEIGRSELARQLRREAQPAPQPLARALAQLLGPDCLLLVDQCETVLDHQGQVANPYLRELLTALLRHTGWRGLVMVRMASATIPPTFLMNDLPWFVVDELTRDERKMLLRLALPHSSLRWETLNVELQRFVLNTVAGHPYAFHLFLSDPGDDHSTVVTEVRNYVANGVDEYAILDYYLGRVPLMARPMLELLATLEDREPWPFLEGAWHALGSNLGWPARQAGMALTELLRRGLVEESAEGYRLVPVLRHYLACRPPPFGLAAGLAKSFHYHLTRLYEVLAKQVRDQAQTLLAMKDNANAIQQAAGLIHYHAVLRDRALRQALLRNNLRLVRGALEGLLEPVPWRLISRLTAGRCLAYTQRLTTLVEQVLNSQDEDAQPAEVGACYHVIGRICEEIHVWEPALAAYRSALAWWERTRQPHRIGDTWLQIGMVHARQRQWLDALSAYRTALDWWERTRQYPRMGQAWYRIGRLHGTQNNWEEALAAYRTALDWQVRTKRQDELGSTWQRIGEVHEALGQLSAAILAYAQTLEALHTLNTNNTHRQSKLLKFALAAAQRLLANAPPVSASELARLQIAVDAFHS